MHPNLELYGCQVLLDKVVVEVMAGLVLPADSVPELRILQRWQVSAMLRPAFAAAGWVVHHRSYY